MAKSSLQGDIKRAAGQTVIRWFFYTGFMVCSVSMIALLGLGGAWWAPMIGTVAFGIPTVIAYLDEQERQEVREDRAEKRQQNAGGGGGWDLQDDDSGDPTQPPQRMT